MTLQSSEWPWATMSALTVVLPILSALVVYLLLRRWGRAWMVCGKCEYPVRGLTKPRCPECGSSFREAGIAPAGRRPRQMTAVLVGAWTFAVVIAAWPSYWWVRPHLPQATEVSQTTALRQPPSRAYGSVEIAAHARWRAGWFRPHTLHRLNWTATIRGEPDATVEVDEVLGTAVFRYESGVERLAGKLDEAHFAEWLLCLVPNADVELLEMEAQEILQAARDWAADGPPAMAGFARTVMTTGGAFRSSSTSVGQLRQGPTMNAIMVYITGVAGLWLYIASGIVRAGRRRLLRSMDAMRS